MKIHRANRKGLFRSVILAFLALSLAIIVIDRERLAEQPWLFLSLVIPLGFLLWIYFDTSYGIDHGALHYRSGFLRGRIAIHAIEEVVEGTTLWVGVKPALARNGLIIRYDVHRQVYIAPESNEALIADLVSVNPGIRVTRRTAGSPEAPVDDVTRPRAGTLE